MSPPRTPKGRVSHRRAARPLPMPTNFYASVIAAGEAGALAAAGSPSLDDEIALLRLLVRRQIEEQPEHLEATLKALHLLVRMATAQHRLSGADASAFEERAGAVIEQFATAFFAADAETHE